MKRIAFVFIMSLLCIGIASAGQYNDTYLTGSFYKTPWSGTMNSIYNATFCGNWCVGKDSVDVGKTHYMSAWDNITLIGGGYSIALPYGTSNIVKDGCICKSSGDVFAIDMYYKDLYIIEISADFNGVPTSGSAPLPVQFTDNSTSYRNITSYNWSVSPPGGVSIVSPTSKDTAVYFATVGNYSITHGVSNGVNSSILTKTDYIYVYNSTATVTTGFTAIDAMSGATIYNATISLFDVQNSSWSNTTNSASGIAYITTLQGHTIGSKATALGYGDSDYVIVPALSGAPYVILLFPPALPPGDGNTNLFVSIQDYDTHQGIQGATVTTRLPTGAQQGTTTNAAGVATFVVPNQTLIIIGASKAGYVSASDTINSGTGTSASDIIYLHRSIVTTSPTTVVPTGTVSGNVTVDARTSAEKQTAMANMVLEYGPLLVNLFIILTIVGGIKLIAKK